MKAIALSLLAFTQMFHNNLAYLREGDNETWDTQLVNLSKHVAMLLFMLAALYYVFMGE